MSANTTVQITPKLTGVPVTISHKTANVDLHNDSISTFSFVVEDTDGSLVNRFTVGDEVNMWQNGIHTMRGYLARLPKSLNATIRLLEFSGYGFKGKTKRLLVTKEYVDQTLSAIVTDLVTSYIPWCGISGIETTSQKASFKFQDEYLYDVLDKIAAVESWNWDIDVELNFQFFGNGTRLNPNLLSESGLTYKKGSARFERDSENLVNRLRIRGGMATSADLVYDNYVGDGVQTVFQLSRQPDTSTWNITVGGVIQAVGDDFGDGVTDAKYNSSENTIKFVSAPGNSEAINMGYKYKYRILQQLDDRVSQEKYGLFEDKIEINLDDPELTRLQGSNHLKKYANPFLHGNIEPLTGEYRPGENVQISIPSLEINEQLKIVSVSYISRKNIVDIVLSLETAQREVKMLKEIVQTLRELKKVYQDQGNLEVINKFFAILGINVSYTVTRHQYYACGTVTTGEGRKISLSEVVSSK